MQTAKILEENVYTVSRLNSEARSILENTFMTVWVEGEISNFAAPNSGHWYFCLKDASAQINCAMFKGNQRRLVFTPKDGNHVLVKAKISLYEATGRYQLIIEDMEERGEGKLRRAYEILKKKLEAAGLFSLENKKALPTFPKQIGVITSATGAAIRDILTVLKRRFPIASVIIYPSLVQGETAAPAIVKALQLANERNECDILILARGGGSLEDLWPFNEEIVAHAIFESKIPIISGVGHEVDFTIADFVSDVRAPTPSAAAEIATPDQIELQQLLLRYNQQISRSLNQRLATFTQHVNWIDKHLQQQHPKRRLGERMQQLDLMEVQLVQLMMRKLTGWNATLKHQHSSLQLQSPLYFIIKLENQLRLVEQTFIHLMPKFIQYSQSTFANLAAKLNTLSPLATLERGYAIATKEDGIVLRSASNAKVNDIVQLKLLEGSLRCRVEKVEN